MAKGFKTVTERQLDPIYEYVFRNKMDPFIQWAAEWWSHWTEETFFETGSYPAEGAPPGAFVRYSRTLAHSPVHGVQAFPYVSVPFLQMHHIPGGVRKLVDSLCHGGIVIDGFRLIERKYLHGTERNGQFICIVPEAIILDAEESEGVRGRYVWLCANDIISLASGVVDAKMRARFKHYCGGKDGQECKDGENEVDI
jgi:hypothetical protein